MTGELPEGTGPEDVRGHAMALGVIGGLINATSTYLLAEGGSTAESEAEDALDEYLERVLDMGAEVGGKVMLVFASLIVQVGDEAAVQEWFNDQSARLAPFLAEMGLLPTEESGD